MNNLVAIASRMPTECLAMVNYSIITLKPQFLAEPEFQPLTLGLKRYVRSFAIAQTDFSRHFQTGKSIGVSYSVEAIKQHRLSLVLAEC
jgi:hypothetical protein